MELSEIIKNRHSIREYEKKEVELKKIGEILSLAENAPSSGNIQNWRFIVVNDKEKKNLLAKACLNQTWMNEAPVFIVVCYDVSDAKTLYPEDYEKFSIQNCAVISTYIILIAEHLGLGSCWVDVNDQEKVSRILDLPENIKGSVIITLGYKKGDYKKTKRYSFNDFTFFEKYGNRIAKKPSFNISKYTSKLRKR